MKIMTPHNFFSSRKLREMPLLFNISPPPSQLIRYLLSII